MATAFTASCNVLQGYNFKYDQHQTFGYISTLVLGDNPIAPDIKVVDPAAIASPGNTGTGNVFSKPVVSILEEVTWSTLPNENILLRSRISVANAAQLNMLAMQSLKRVSIALSFVVYKYDLVNQKYFTHFMSYTGVVPNSSSPVKGGGTGAGVNPDKIIYAVFGKTSGTDTGLQISAHSQEDSPGMINHTLELALAPPIARSPQQILIQTSDKIKLIQPWGLPQH